MQTTSERDQIEEIKEAVSNFLNNSNIDSVFDFPIHVLPKALQEIIYNVSSAYGIDKGFLSGSILFAYSMAIGNTHVLQLKKGQSEKSVLYLTLVARPSSNKSAALKFALSPVQKIENKLWKDFEEQRKEYEIWKDIPKKERFMPFMDEPKLTQYILIDSTMEATSLAHQVNKRGIAIHRDEIAGLFKDFNKYRAGSDMENFLTNWSGGSIKINRLSRSPIYISDAFISVAGTIQPTVLREMSKDFLKSGAGFIDRFLFIYPDKQEVAEYTDNEANLSLVSLYEENLTKVLELPYIEDEYQKSNPNIVQFKEDAKAKVYHWLNQVNKPLIDSSTDLMAGIHGKFNIHFQRICLILHFVKWSYGQTEGREQISLETVNQAIEIVDFFRSHTKKVQSELNNIDPKIILEDQELKLYNPLPELIETSKCQMIADSFGKKQTAFYNFLNEYPELFSKEKRGFWKKIKK